MYISDCSLIIGDKNAVAWIWFLKYLFGLIWQKNVNLFPYCHPYLILYLACSLVVANFEARISTYGLQLSAGNFIVVWVELNPEGQLSAWNWEKALLQVFCSYLPNYCPHCPKLKMNGKKLSKNPVYIVSLVPIITYCKQFCLCLPQCWFPSCFHRTRDLQQLHCQLLQHLELKWEYLSQKWSRPRQSLGTFITLHKARISLKVREGCWVTWASFSVSQQLRPEHSANECSQSSQIYLSPENLR